MTRAGIARAADGCRLHYESRGQGPCVLLACGLGGLGSFWDPVASALAARHRVLTFDHRGCGRSDRPDQDYSVERLAQDAIAVLDHAEVERADVVGHSTGGAIGQAMALEAPHRIGRLVATGAWARPDARFKALFEHRIAVLEGCGPAAYTRQSQLLGYPPEWFDTHAAGLDQAVAGASAALSPLAVAVARLRMLLAFDRAAELARLTLPALVLAAPDDATIPFAMSEELARLIPGAVFEALPGGHFFPQVQAERYAARVASFLDYRP